MKRPNRYPYSKKQWVENTAVYYSYYDDEPCFSQRVLENRLTGEIKSEEEGQWE